MGIYVRTRDWMELHLHLGQMVGGTVDGREGYMAVTARGPLHTQEFAVWLPE